MVRGQVVLISGAARGIGASTARLLHRRGARLVLIDVDESGLRTLADELGGAEDVLWVRCDVTDFEAMQAAAEAGMRKMGAIDAVVANAGIEHWGPVRTVDPETFRKVVDVNLIGVFHTIRAVLPSIIERRGYILVVASVSSYTAVPGMAAYGASKAGVEHLANVVRLELDHLGVRVGSAHMSLVDTPMLRETRSASREFEKYLATLPIPMRRPISADRCAVRLVDAIEHRKQHVDVPRWVAATRWLKPLLVTRLAQRRMSP